MAHRLDIVLFGATGFTGKHAIPMIAKFTKTKNRQLTWGIAGRSEKKLREILSDCEKKTGFSLNNIPIIIASVDEKKTLNEMARKARIIINCCGPFRFYGEAVVKACVEEGTHHVDVSGEIQYMEEMQLKYHKQAEEKGIYIISACGYDCIPVDMGTVFMEQKFEGTLNSVVAYFEFWEEGESVSGSAFNYGTWESVINILAHAKELKTIRRQLFPKPLPKFKPELKPKIIPHQADVVGGWAFPFHTTDRPVVKRSQRYFYERNSKRPVQLETYFVVKSALHLIGIAIFALIVLLLSKFSLGEKLLLKYPEWFTGGMISREPPNEERITKGCFSMTLYGEGWKEKLSDANDQYANPPNKSMTAKVQGRNPGYGATNVCLVLAAITVLTETDKMPRSGGVYPPGYAFANTSLIQQLNENDVKFKILAEKDLPTSK